MDYPELIYSSKEVEDYSVQIWAISTGPIWQ